MFTFVSCTELKIYDLSFFHCTVRHRHCWSLPYAGRVSNMNLVYGLALHEFSVAQVDRTPTRCLGGHRFESCRGLRFFLCLTLGTCWLIHFHICLTELKLPSFILSLIFSFPPWGVLRTHNWPALSPVGLNSSFRLERYVGIRKDKASIPGQTSNLFLFLRFFFNRLGCSFNRDDHFQFHILLALSAWFISFI